MSHGGVLAVGGGFELRPRRVAALILGALLACVAALALVLATSPSSPASHPPALRAGAQHHPPALVPAGLAAAASGSIGAAERGFWPIRRGPSLLAHGGHIHATFTSAGASLRVPGGSLGLSLSSIGRGHSLDPVAAVAPTAVANEALYRRGSVSESYRNGPYGLEQGFTVARRPQAGSGPLVLALRLRGSLTPQQLGSEILFRTRAGATALSYGQLSAVDATGRRLPARMQLRNDTVQLLIDDSNARYPIVIDPFIGQGAKLTGGGESAKGEFGESVALSQDGSTALIGAGSNSHHVGAAWVFTRSGETWTQQAKLTGAGESGEGRFGASVALSQDGNTALIGGYGDDEGVGAAWAFTRSGSTWSAQGAKLTGGGEGAGAGHFGYSVALSGDGNTALIGGGSDSHGLGAAWVFTRASGKWTQQGSKLIGAGESAEGHFGASVALAADGKTALIGGYRDGGATGAAWVFTRSGEEWTQQGPKLTGAGESGEGEFADSVALSGDGNTALIGGSRDNSETGAAWVFTRSGEEWKQQGAKLTGAGEVGPGHFGYSVALAENGNTALIGAGADNGGLGAAWVFTRAGSTWNQQGHKLTGAGESGAAHFGFSVALAANGNTALIGGYADGRELGAAWVFAYATPSAPTVETGAASSIGSSSATLGAKVNPNEGEVSNCHFEYGTSPTYGASVPCASLPGSGSVAVEVSAAVASLLPNTPYHFRIVATNPGGTSQGKDAVFMTAPRPPTAETGEASSIGSRSATLGAKVNPNEGEVTDCHFEYGTSMSYGASAPCASLPGSGSVAVEVSAAVTGLMPNTPYHFRIVATSAGGTGYGEDHVFTTSPSAPTVVSGPVSSLESTSVTLGGSVNPNSEHVSECYFEYGTSVSYGASAACASLPGAGGSAVAVSAPVGSLSPHTPYHFRLVATNATGTTRGEDAVFTTTPNAPAVETGEASSIGSSSATLGAKVNPNEGEVTVCRFEYGTSVSYGASAPCASLPGSGSAPVAVSAAVAGLLPNTPYHFRIVATNAGGTSKGTDGVFTTAPSAPTVVTGSVSSLTQTSVTLGGSVNPNSQEVSKCYFEYGTSVSYGTSVACAALPGSGPNAVSVSGSLTGLSPGTEYHYRLVATNATGTSKGEDGVFTTVPSAPIVVSGSASSITSTSATLNATVDPNERQVSDCHFEYGTTTSYGANVACASLPGSGSTPVEVSALATGLRPNKGYHFRIVATNPGGTSYGADRTFTTAGAPEFGRCLKQEGKHGAFTASTCLAESLTDSGPDEWYPGVAQAPFTLSAHTVVLETASATQVTCQNATGGGEYRGATGVANVLLKLSGCVSSGHACTTPGLAEGDLETKTLEGVLGWEIKSSKKVALEIFPVVTTGPFMEYSCAGGALVTVTGSVLVPVVVDKMLTTTTLAFKASKGKQKPEHFEGAPSDVLKASLGGGPLEPLGLAGTATQTNAEAVEVNAIV